MRGRWQFVLGAVLAAVLIAGGAWAFAQEETPGGDEGGPVIGGEVGPRGHRGHGKGFRIPGLGRSLTHADIHVFVDGTEHVIRIDAGTVQSASETEVVIEELNGNTVSVPLGEGTTIRVNGEEAGPGDLDAGYRVVTLRVDDQPARFVRAYDPDRNPLQRFLEPPSETDAEAALAGVIGL